MEDETSMASEKSRSRQSPEIRLHPPQRRKSVVSVEEKVKDGNAILQRLQSKSRPTSSSLLSQERRKSCFPFGEKTHGEDVKTIRGKVRSTESLSGKGLIAADLLKNLKSQGGLMPRKLSNGLLTVGNEPQRCHTASDVRRSPSPVNHARRAVSAGYRTLNNGPPIRPDSNDGTRTLTVHRPQSEISPRLLRQRGSTHPSTQRRGSLPVANLMERRNEANSILKKYSSTNELDEDSPRNGYDNRVSLPSLPRAKSATMLMPIMHDSAEDDESDSLTNAAKSPVPRPRSSSMNKRRFSQVKPIQQVKNSYSPRNDRCDESDNEVRSLSSDNGSDSSDENDSESDNDNGKAKRKNKVEDSRLGKSKRTSPRAGKKENTVRKNAEKKIMEKRKESSDESTDSGSSSSEESDTNNDENINTNKQSKQEVNNNESKTNKVDSETDEDESDHEDHVSNDLVLINEELETLAKEMATPGMPAVDLLESHEKLINQMNHVKKKDSKKRMNHTDHEDGQEAVGDDIDDLIDTIDDLIDADDEDITYANKQELKKKSFKNKVGLVISTNKLGK